MLSGVIRSIDGLNNAIGRATAWLTAGMVLGYCLVVGLRYGFGIGFIGLQEAVTYMHAAVFMLAAAYTLNHDDHVRVDIFYRDMSPRGQAWVNLLGSLLLLLPVALFILATSFGYVTDAWARGEVSSEAGGLPFVYLLKTLILIMAGQLVLAAVARAGSAWLQLAGAAE